MDEKELKRQLLELAQELGAHRVATALMIEGLSPRHSEKLALGDHEGSFRRKTVAAVKAVIAKGKARAS